MPATKKNAQDIYELLGRAVDNLASAVSDLRDATALAEQDYELNDEILKKILPAVDLLAGETNVERCKWDSYARNRDE